MKRHPTRELNVGERHLLRLIARAPKDDDWASVSAPLMPLMRTMPDALVVLEDVGMEGRGRVKLTPLGRSVVDAMAWLL